MIRVFVAVDLSSEALLELERFIDTLSSKRWPVRWENADKLHLTLFFVGSVEEEKIEAITNGVMRGVEGVPAFSIRMGKLGVFPDFVQPRVIWLGVKGDQPTLVHLRKQLAERLVVAGFADEKRAWLPHLTVGRVKKDTKYRAKRELGRQLRKLEVDEFKEESLINQVVVYQSVLKPSGSEYRKLSEVSLE
ncbi:RNA 2',3'-cyclic phosphodiesterase [Patescibacteria group bacterium]|nr:RNA 2',3'-cyclic phosphodiesterase [Patescibacteria group bacterium]